MVSCSIVQYPAVIKQRMHEDDTNLYFFLQNRLYEDDKNLYLFIYFVQCFTATF